MGTEKTGRCAVTAAGIRINVIGASGSGATTVGKELARLLGVPHFDSDDYYHGPSDPPFQNPRSPQDRYDLVCRDLVSSRDWVLSGGVLGWDPCPDLNFTSVVFLYVPTRIRLVRLRQRELERFGDRIAEQGDMYAMHHEFLRWASRYDAGDVEGKTLARHREFLMAQHCPVLEIRGNLGLASIADQIMTAIRSRQGIRHPVQR